MPRKSVRETRVEKTKTFANIADRLSQFKSAREVLVPVTAVPTDFVQFDHATRIGGLPTGRITLIHGPSAGGKSLFALGLTKSFLKRGHFAFFVDAERTTDSEWVSYVFGEKTGAETFASPLFKALRPMNYEDAVDQVRAFAQAVKKLRIDGEVSPETSFLIVVDSLKKLIPKDHTKKLLKEGAEGAGFDGMGGRAAMQQAGANTSWMNELVPLLDDCGGSALIVARESEDPNADAWAKKYGKDFRITGGKAIYYDASLVLRAERASWISQGEGEEKKIFGERHRITIDKSKVGTKDGKNTLCYFHSSNGGLIPVGLDRARDVLELALRFDIVKRSGAWMSFGKEKLGAGESNAVKRLTGDDELLAKIEQEVRAEFEKISPVQHTEDGEVLE